MYIRISSLADLSELKTLVYDSYQHGYRKFNMHELAEATTMDVIENCILLPPDQTWVAVSSGKTVGMVSICDNSIERIFVCPQHQRNKVASQLLQYGLNVIRNYGYDHATSEIVKENYPSRLLFEKYGAIQEREFIRTLRNDLAVKIIRYRINFGYIRNC